jgi:hypothetical protein
LRLSTLRPVQIDITDDTGGETFRRFNAEPGQLWIGDRGYANPPGIAAIKASGAEVLVRYNRGSLPLFGLDGNGLDVLKMLGALKCPGKAEQCYAEVHPRKGESIPGRLCALLLPPDKAEEARERARQEQGASVTAETLEAAQYVVVFTTVPLAMLNAELVLELYGLRWQVELHIKRDKSIAGLDKLPNFRKDTVYSWICAKMLLTQIARKIATSNVAIPPCAQSGWFLARPSKEGASGPLIGINRKSRRGGIGRRQHCAGAWIWFGVAGVQERLA